MRIESWLYSLIFVIEILGFLKALDLVTGCTFTKSCSYISKYKTTVYNDIISNEMKDVKVNVSITRPCSPG